MALGDFLSTGAPGSGDTTIIIRPVAANACRASRGAGRMRAWCAGLLMLALLVYGLGVSRHWRVGMDAALYTSIARSVATGQGYTFSGMTQTSIPPATPLYLAAAYRLGHAVEPGISFLDTFLYFNAFMLAVGLAGLVVGFFLIREMVFGAGPPPEGAGRPVELSAASLVVVATALLVFSQRYYALSMEEMSDAPYALVSWAAILFLLRSRRGAGGGRLGLVAAAVLLALVPLVRMVGLALVGSVAAFFLIEMVFAKKRREAVVGLATVAPALIACAAMMGAIWLNRGKGTFNYFGDASGDGVIAEALAAFPAHLGGIPGRLLGALFGLGSMAAPGLAVFAVVAVGAVNWWRRGQRLVIFYVACYLAMTAALYEVQTRYFVPLLPFIFLFAVEGVLALASAAVGLLSRASYAGRAAACARATATIGAATLLALTLLVNALLIGRAVSLNFSDDFYRQYKKGQYYDYLSLARDLAAGPPPGAVMAREHRAIFALSSVAVASPPYSEHSRRRPDTAGMTAYVRALDVSTIVIDPKHAESARVFNDYMARGPFAWRLTGSYGTILVYSRPL